MGLSLQLIYRDVVSFKFPTCTVPYWNLYEINLMMRSYICAKFEYLFFSAVAHGNSITVKTH